MDAAGPPSEASSSSVDDGLDRPFYEDDYDSQSDCDYPSYYPDDNEGYKGSLEDPDAKKKLELYSADPNEIEKLMIYSTPVDMDPVRASLQSPFDTTPTTGLGKLDCLPLEIIVMILRHMDILVFFRFRQVNVRARELASTTKEYGVIAKHALGVVRAMLRTRTGHTLTISRLFYKLLTHRCTVCGDFGSLLSLATAERCCIHCNRNSIRFHVLPLRQFCKVAKITPEVLNQHAKVQLRTLPGQWDIELEKLGNYPSHLIPMFATAQVLYKAGVIDWYARRRLWATKQPYVHRLMTATPFPSYDPKTDTVQRGIYCRFCRYFLEDDLDEYDEHDECEEEWLDDDEFEARAAHVEAKWRSKRIHIFSHQGLLTHLEKCSHAQEAWNKKQSETDD